MRLLYAVRNGKKICTAYHLVNGCNTQACHVLSQLLCDKSHEVLHILRFSAESLTKFRILGSHTNRAGIQIADSHHHAAHGYKGSSCKTEFLCTEKCCDSNVTAAHQLTVCLDTYTVTKSVHDQCLMCLCKSQLPRKSCIVDGASRCRSGTSVVSGDQNGLCSGFCNTGSDRTDTSLGNQFYGNICILVCIFQVIDQLCQILDGVDIVVWRRRDQADSRCGMTGFCNPRINLLCWKMSAFTRLCTLCHLDLDLSCRYQVTAGNTETSAGYLFDRRAAVIVCSRGIQTLITFATLTGIGFSMEMVHGDGQCLMCFLGNGTVGHGTCLKSFYNVVNTLNLVDGKRLFCKLEVQKSS